MKYCPFCGVVLQENMLFCPSCGKNLHSFSINVEAHPEMNEAQNADFVSENVSITDECPNPANPKSKKKLVGWIIAFISITVVFFVVVSLASQSNIDDICTSVLCLELYDDSNLCIGTASGFLIQDGTTLVTNYHVIDGTYHIVAKTADGNSSTIVDNVISYSEKYDLAILKCEEELGVLPISLGNTMEIKQGDVVYAVGYPLGLANSLSDGVISSLFEDDGVKIIQTTAAISAGSSGGVLLNKKGEAIGVTTASYEDGQNMNLAIPISYLADLSANQYCTTLAELFESKIPHYSVDYVMAHYDDLISSSFYVDGWLSTFAKYPSGFVWMYMVDSPDKVYYPEYNNIQDGYTYDRNRTYNMEAIRVDVDYSNNRPALDLLNLQLGQHIQIRCYGITEPLWFDGEFITTYSVIGEKIAILSRIELPKNPNSIQLPR